MNLIIEIDRRPTATIKSKFFSQARWTCVLYVQIFNLHNIERNNKMYNGIGLTTPRGSGTNGYVQTNWASPNQDILDHERKRKIEVKCAELEDSLEEQGLPKEEIAARVAAFRAKLSESSSGEKDVPRDEFGRVA
ncbi:unnamed protein product, partial [Iphiclides podalirius]